MEGEDIAKQSSDERRLQTKPKNRLLLGKWFWAIAVVLLVLLILIGRKALTKNDLEQTGEGGDSKSEQGVSDKLTGQYPKCPADLSGLLTYQLMDPKYIGSMIPLGNVAPPGHTDPVDHIYFNLNTDDRVPLYAPADGWITHIMANSTKETATSDYKFDSFVVTYTICDGLILDFAGYNDVNQKIKDELSKHKDSCKGGITKSGHESAAEQQCDYQDLNIKVTSGEEIGYTQRAKRSEGGYNIPFEIWTANYNQAARSDVNWDKYYGDDRYAHNYCTFDLYSGELKKQFEAKFGDYSINTVKDDRGNVTEGAPVFTQRTIQPVCGKVNQDLVGTLQGAWFSHTVDQGDKSGNVGESGYGITFVPYNMDPTRGIIGIGGEMDNNLTGIAIYSPSHSGTINRAPSEVKADGKVYCYEAGDAKVSNSGQSFSGKILVQLLDDHHIKTDHQSGSCSANESFKNSYTFER